jgi:dinuclear metal center YbgI/SA1388 family protein
MPSLRDVVDVLDALYDPTRAEDWDAVGTVVGDPEQDVEKILFAVDPVQAVVDEAIAWGADLVVTHHPLWLKGVTSMSAATPKGRVAHTLNRHGIALHTCHTNADSPALGVSESMALALGLSDVRPLDPDPAPPIDAWVVYVPVDDADAVVAAMHEAGAGAIGDYEQVFFRSEGIGSFRPVGAANPTIGTVGEIERVDEIRVELVAPPRLRETVRTAMVAAHPYEQVAHQILEIQCGPDDRGSGRVGVLAAPTTLGDFAHAVTAALPAHHSANRVAGDLTQPVRTVALCGGSGDFLLGAATAVGADVYVTSDLRHHPVSEHLEAGGCAVIDVPHWSAEWTWLPVAAAAVTERLSDLQVHVSQVVTDPWSAHVAGTVST